jgi:hypothetical protein
MKCHEAKRHVDLFMDGELSVPENLKVLEHLNLCRACASAYEGEKALRGALRSQLGGRPRARRPGAKLAGSPAPRRGWSWSSRRRPAPASSRRRGRGVLPDRPDLRPHDPRREARGAGHGALEDAQGDPLGLLRAAPRQLRLFLRHLRRDVTVEKFFKRQVGRESCSHYLSDLGYTPIGASVESHRGQPVCWTVHQDKAGHTITHGQITTKIAMEPGPLLVCDGVERPVVLIPADSGMTCAFVFDDEGEAQRFRKAKGLK